MFAGVYSVHVLLCVCAYVSGCGASAGAGAIEPNLIIASAAV